MWAVGFIIIGYILYGIYWVVVNFWAFVLAGAFCIWAAPRLLRAYKDRRELYATTLKEQQALERGQNDLFSRFSDKEIKLLSFHWLYLLMILVSIVAAYHSVIECYSFARHEGWIRAIPRDYRDLQYVVWCALFSIFAATVFRMMMTFFNRVRSRVQIFATYQGLLRHANTAQNSEEALAYAPSIRDAAKHHVRSFYDLFVFEENMRSKNTNTSHYKNKRLRDVLTYLEKYFPHDDTDENFRRRYWNYASHIFKLLHFREDPFIEDSIFALPYPESEKVKAQRLRETLKSEREKYQNEPQDVWSKQVDMITLKDALELVGMIEVPPVQVLHKLHMAVLDDHKDDPKKAKLTAKAFELLGAQAVQNEMS